MRFRTIMTLCVVAAGLGGAAIDTQPPAKVPLAFSPLSTENLETQGRTLHFGGSEINLPLVFCGRKRAEGDDFPYEPAILRFHEGNWEICSIREMACQSWGYVAQQWGTGRIWALASGACGDAGSDYEVIFTPDGGNTWEHMATITKVYYMADFRSFRMNSKGEGSIEEYLEPNLAGDLKGGYYTHYTKDWGRTWSKPEFTEDVLQTRPESGDDQPIIKLLEELTPHEGGK